MNRNRLKKALEQDALVREERIPVDMNKQKISEIIQRFKEFLDDQKLTQPAVARKLGVSPTTINQFVNDKYKGDLVSLATRALNFMDGVIRRQKKQKGKRFIKTSVAKQIFTVITQTENFSDDQEGKIGIVAGDAGHGKSECLREYAKAKKDSAVYVELESSMSPTEIWAAICKALGISHAGSMGMLKKNLIDYLEYRDMTILLDEASHLNVRAMDRLRQILVVKCKCPLVLAGNGQLLNSIYDDSNRRGYQALDQFFSRIVYICNLDELALSKGDGGEGLYTAADVRNLYERGGIKLTSDAVKAIQKICRAPHSGRLRTCGMVIDALLTTPEVTTAGQIDSTIIVAALRELGLPVAQRLPFTLIELKEESAAEAVAMAG